MAFSFAKSKKEKKRFFSGDKDFCLTKYLFSNGMIVRADPIMDYCCHPYKSIWSYDQHILMAHQSSSEDGSWG